MKIGIFGGTFDPFHLGHAMIAKKSLEHVDKLFIVPTTCNYYRSDKRHLFSFDERCRIINQFITSIPGDVEIDTIEKDQPSSWRTINTVEYYKDKFPNDSLYLILGADSLNSFNTWFRYDDILNLCNIIVANRNENVKLDYDIKNLINLDIGDKYVNVSATAIRDKLISELTDMYLSDEDWYAEWR